MASTINKRPRRKRAGEKTSEFIKQEEQYSELNCSKIDKDLESDNKSILIDTPKINDNNTSICKEKYDKYTSIYRFKYVELETFDTFYVYIKFKKCIDDILKSLNFGKKLDSKALSETNNVNSIKHLEEKINELQNQSKQLQDENRTVSEIIKYIDENECITESKSNADYYSKLLKLGRY